QLPVASCRLPVAGCRLPRGVWARFSNLGNASVATFSCSFLGQFNPEHPVAIGGGDVLVLNIGGDLDLTDESAVVDLHQVDPQLAFARGLSGAVEGGHDARPAEGKLLIMHLDVDSVLVDAGEVD